MLAYFQNFDFGFKKLKIKDLQVLFDNYFHSNFLLSLFIYALQNLPELTLTNYTS